MSERFFEGSAGSDQRRSAPAVSRNVEPIGAVLADWLPATGLVLEIASGTGEHGLAFAHRFPAIRWQPSDVDPDALASIEGWRGEGPANLRSPIAIDAAARDWPIAAADAIVAINMVHISPWESALGLLDGAERILPLGGPLILYGPWIEHGVATMQSNHLFDMDLRRCDPRWGLRSLADFVREAEARGLILEERRAMPANNIMVKLSRH